MMMPEEMKEGWHMPIPYCSCGEKPSLHECPKDVHDLKNKVKLLEDYAKFMGEELADMAAIAWLHGCESKPENILKGAQFRVKLGIATQWDLDQIKEAEGAHDHAP